MYIPWDAIITILGTMFATSGISIGVDELMRAFTTDKNNTIKQLNKVVNEAATRLGISYQDAIDKITKRENDILMAATSTNAARNLTLQHEGERLSKIKSKVNKEYQAKIGKLNNASNTSLGYENTPNLNPFSDAAEEAEKLINSGIRDAESINTKIETEVK